MKILNAFLTAFGLLSFSLRAADQVPAPRDLLPDDTIAVLTWPDWGKASAFFHQSSYGQLWDDPAIKPFREKFEKKFAASIAEPFQKELGMKLEEYKSLLQGQLTFALTPPTEGSTDPVGLLILLDAKDKSDALSVKLSDLKKKWTEGGRQTKSEKIRDVDFTTITITQQEMRKFFRKVFSSSTEKEPEEDKDVKNEKMDLRIGQSKSLLVIGENPKAIEKVLARQGGGLLGSLGEQAAFQKNRAAAARDTLMFGWLNWKPVYDLILKTTAKPDDKEEAVPGMPNMKPEKILPVLGLKNLDSMGFSLTGNADGSTGEFFISMPEAQREGLFQIFNLQAKDASPPPFVPADAVKFQRWRIDAQKSWASLENMLNKIDPGIAAMVQSALQFAGKDKDPNFDVKKSLIGNLGDDFITYQKLPKSAKVADLATPPTLFLIGSQKPEQIVDSIRLLTSLLPPTMSATPPKEREFLGKKVYTLTSVAVPEEGDDQDKKGDKKKDEAPPAPAQTFSFCASGGYVAMSTDNAILEEYLRSGEQQVKPLRDTPGLADAAAKASGMDKGMFGYENQRETMRHTLEVLKSDKEGMEKMFSFNMIFRVEGEEGDKGLKEWLDYTLLPNFDQIAKYFSLGVYSGGSLPDGFSFRGYSPAPKK